MKNCLVGKLKRAVGNYNLPYKGYIGFNIPANETLVNRTFSLAFTNAETVKILNGNFVQSDGTTDHVDFPAGGGKNVYVGAEGGTVLIPRYDVIQLICASSIYCIDGPVLTDASFIKWNTDILVIRARVNADINVDDVASNVLLNNFVIKNLDNKNITGSLSSFAPLSSLERLVLFGKNSVIGNISDLSNNKGLEVLYLDPTSVITGAVEDLAAAQFAGGRTSGTIDIVNESGMFTYNGGVFKRGNIVFSGSGYVINQTS